jgi:SAM-dependent methyltransferase
MATGAEDEVVTSDASWLDSMPATYDRGLGPVLFAPWAAELGRRAAAFEPADVLELAAGTGLTTVGLVEALPEARIVATDLNPGMVAWGASHVQGPEWQPADAQSLPFGDGTFDLVVCAFGAMFFPDKPAAYAEIARVLRPGGRFLAAIWDVVETSPMTAALVDSLKTVLPTDPPSFVVRVPHGYTDVDRISTDLSEGGLAVEAIENVVLTGRAESTRELTEGFCTGTPLRFELEKRGDLAELTAAVAAEMTARLGPGPIERGLGAHVVTAVTA